MQGKGAQHSILIQNQYITLTRFFRFLQRTLLKFETVILLIHNLFTKTLFQSEENMLLFKKIAVCLFDTVNNTKYFHCVQCLIFSLIENSDCFVHSLSLSLSLSAAAALEVIYCCSMYKKRQTCVQSNQRIYRKTK